MVHFGILWCIFMVRFSGTWCIYMVLFSLRDYYELLSLLCTI